MVHVDPDGHIAIVATAAIGAGVGALIGAGAYYLSLDNPQSDFRWDECLLVAGTGAAAGGLIGTGVGALAGAKLMSGGLMAASTAAVHTGAGVGMGMQGGSTLYQNHKAGEDFHAAEFMINSAGGAAEGAFTTAIPGTGFWSATVRAASSGAINELTYVSAEMAQGRVPSGQEAFDVLIFSAGGAFYGYLIGQGISGSLLPDPGRTPPVTIQDHFRSVPGYDTRGLMSRNPKLLRNSIMAQATLTLRDTGQQAVMDWVLPKPR